MVISGGTWPSVGRNARRPRGLMTYLGASTPHLPNSLPLLHLFTPVAPLLYQEYSDVFLNKEIQSQQRLDSLMEAPGPISLQQPRKALVSSESYLHRLSMASSGSLWQEIPVVRNSTVLLSMTHEDQKLQEVPPGGVGQGLRKGKQGLLCSCPCLLLSTPTTTTSGLSLPHSPPRHRVTPSLLGSSCSVNITTLPPIYLLLAPSTIYCSMLLV